MKHKDIFINLSKETGLPVKKLEHIYKLYLSIINSKLEEYYKELLNQPLKTREELYYDKSGKYCFYLRYLGKYYINYKAYVNDYKKHQRDKTTIHSSGNHSR